MDRIIRTVDNDIVSRKKEEQEYYNAPLPQYWPLGTIPRFNTTEMAAIQMEQYPTKPPLPDFGGSGAALPELPIDNNNNNVASSNVQLLPGNRPLPFNPDWGAEHQKLMENAQKQKMLNSNRQLVSLSDLPENWLEQIHPNGKTFYVNKLTGESQWKRPVINLNSDDGSEKYPRWEDTVPAANAAAPIYPQMQLYPTNPAAAAADDSDEDDTPIGDEEQLPMLFFNAVREHCPDVEVSLRNGKHIRVSVEDDTPEVKRLAFGISVSKIFANVPCQRTENCITIPWGQLTRRHVKRFWRAFLTAENDLLRQQTANLQMSLAQMHMYNSPTVGGRSPTLVIGANSPATFVNYASGPSMNNNNSTPKYTSGPANNNTPVSSRAPGLPFRNNASPFVNSTPSNRVVQVVRPPFDSSSSSYVNNNNNNDDNNMYSADNILQMQAAMISQLMQANTTITTSSTPSSSSNVYSTPISRRHAHEDDLSYLDDLEHEEASTSSISAARASILNSMS